MERMIKLVLVGLASVLVATGVLIGPGALLAGPADAANDPVALKRDEDDLEPAEARDDDDDDPTTASRSGSRDRSRDMTTADRSRSLDRSRDLTGDGAGNLDRSNSLDRSRDRSGDHNTRDVSRSRDASADQTSASQTSSDTSS